MQDERQLLSEATAALEAMAYDGIPLGGDRIERYVRAVITEYDRRGARVREVEQDLAEMRGELDGMVAELRHRAGTMRDQRLRIAELESALRQLRPTP